MAGGITYGVAAPLLCRVVDGGVPYDDPRVIQRTNAATKLILDHMIPVGGMAVYDIVAVGTTITLPPQLENAIAVDVRNAATVNGQRDVTQGWYNLVNNSTYIDPEFQHDNPLEDAFLVPDPGDPTVLHRVYNYPGLQPNATVTVVGAKRYIPIKGNDDYLIVQNIEALKRIILSIERAENNAVDDAEKYLQQGLGILQAEVKKHLLDPTATLARKAQYQDDVIIYAQGTLGNTRARLALEIPGYLNKGKSEINYAINHALAAIVDSENQLRIAGRLGVHESTSEITFVPALNATDVFTTLMPTSQGVSDFDIIRRLCLSYDTTDPAQAQAQETLATDLLQKRLTERMEFLRHNTYTTTLSTATPGTVAWTIARLALEMPGGLKLTNTEMRSVFELAEKRLIDAGKYKDTIETFTAEVVEGCLYGPPGVESILAFNLDGIPIPIRSQFFEFLENGPGQPGWVCSPRLVDEGEQYFADNGLTRRKYRLRTGETPANTTPTVTHTIAMVVKLRWYSKSDQEQTTIKNFDAIRLMSQAILLERAEKWQDAIVAKQEAIGILEKELHEFLAGIIHTVRVQDYGWGTSDMQHCGL